MKKTTDKVYKVDVNFVTDGESKKKLAPDINPSLDSESSPGPKSKPPSEPKAALAPKPKPEPPSEPKAALAPKPKPEPKPELKPMPTPTPKSGVKPGQKKSPTPKPKPEPNSSTIFCVFVAVLVVAVILSAFLSSTESRLHEQNFEKYSDADELVEENKYGEALIIYSELISKYPNSYVLECKAAICEFNLGNYQTALERSLRAMETFPLLTEEVWFIEFLEKCYMVLGDDVNALAVSERRIRLT